MILVKLGGSVITDKGRYRTFDRDTAVRLAKEIAASGESVVLVHGAGSFGHVLAKEHSLHLGITQSSQLMGAAMVMSDVRELDLEMSRCLTEAGLSIVPLPPASCAEMSGGDLHMLDAERFRRYLELDMVPMTFGDVVWDRRRGLSICSGDQLMMRLAKELRPDKVIFVTDVDGVFTADPNLDPKATLVETVDRMVLDSLPRTERNVDVTGSIFAKISYMIEMADLTDECLVLNGKVPGRLEAALKGEDIVASKVIGGVK
ncbi:MAG: isopentenyl phosphate kinase family protein [Methanomassiliicoccales archaeon]|nr:isopentenyl phosphate kinase family protein [Methanomassiliicoccales archaeon]